ncbi:MAG: hypothetical protein RRX88_01565 [Raoultibacter sp.]
MAFKKDKNAHFLHIKRYTEGTSNEISLSVLDSRNKAADSEEIKEGKPVRARFAGVVSLFPVFKGGRTPAPEGSEAASDSAPVPEVSVNPAGSVIDSDREIAHRKRQRRTHRILSGIAAFVLVAVVAGTATYFLAAEYQNQHDHQALLSESLVDITAADATIVAMDEAINAPVNEETVMKMQEIQGGLPSAVASLDRAGATAQKAFEGMRDSVDKEAAGQTVAAVAARTSLVEAGTALMQATINTHQAIGLVGAAWSEILSADALAHRAAALVSHTTTENARLSKDENNQALSQFTDAKLKLETAGISAASADLHLLIAYVDKRIKAMNYAIVSDDAIMVQDKKTAEVNNERSNQADIQAAQIAEQFPTDPLQPLYDAYDADTASSFSTYQEARRAAGAADSFLRGYLGTADK